MTDTVQTGEVAARRPKVDPELVERLMAGAGSEADLLGPEGLLSEMTKAVLERALKAELKRPGVHRATLVDGGCELRAASWWRLWMASSSVERAIGPNWLARSAHGPVT